MPVTLCEVGGCFDNAVGAARSRKHCRAHYNELFLAPAEAAGELVVCELIPGIAPGPRGERAGVVDCRTQATVKDGLAVVDPAETNIPALVATGLVRIVAAPESAKDTRSPRSAVAGKRL